MLQTLLLYKLAAGNSISRVLLLLPSVAPSLGSNILGATEAGSLDAAAAKRRAVNGVHSTETCPSDRCQIKDVILEL
jgi:hypothetical protein